MCWKHKFASLMFALVSLDCNGMQPVCISEFICIPSNPSFVASFVECLIFLVALCCSSSLRFLFFLFLPPADIISTVEFNHTGELLATGDKGGRVVIFQREPEVCGLPVWSLIA